MRGILLAAACCVGCGVDTATDESASTTVSVVDVSLVEFSVTPSADTAPAGRVVFRVHNDGTEIHEFIFISTELTIAELPTNPDGSFNEEGEGFEIVRAIERIPVGATRGVSVSLDAGHYVMMCNRVEVDEESGEVEAHFAEGMHADFNVE